MKPVPDITYSVFRGTLNPTRSNPISLKKNCDPIQPVDASEPCPTLKRRRHLSEELLHEQVGPVLVRVPRLGRVTDVGAMNDQ